MAWWLLDQEATSAGPYSSLLPGQCLKGAISPWLTHWIVPVANTAGGAGRGRGPAPRSSASRSWSLGGPTSGAGVAPPPPSGPALSLRPAALPGVPRVSSSDFPVLFCLLPAPAPHPYPRDLSSPWPQPLYPGASPSPPQSLGCGETWGGVQMSPRLGAELRMPLQGVPSAASERCCSGRACPCTPVPATCSPRCCPTTPTWPTAWR